jgi:thioester reductase-like protein
VIRERDSIEDIGVPDGGYAQSKWVAEKLVSTAASRGIPACIYRPGWVSGHSKTGVWDTEDLVFKLAAACLLAGKVPNLDTMVNLAPVDYVSRALVHLSRQRGSAGKVFHLVNPHPAHCDELIEWVRSSGYPLERMSYRRWRAELLDFARLISGDGLDALLVLAVELLPESAIRIPEFDCRNTLDGLAGTSILCPPLISELLVAYFPYFLSI